MISVVALDPALALYRDVLGLRGVGQEPGLAFLRTGDGVELMLHERPVDRGDAAVAIGFAVPNLATTVERWNAAGGRTIAPVSQRPWGERMAVVRDVDRHILTISELP